MEGAWEKHRRQYRRSVRDAGKEIWEEHEGRTPVEGNVGGA